MKALRTTRRTNLGAPLSLLHPFTNSTGSLFGRNADDVYGMPGWLSGEERSRWHRERGDMDYIVVSYGTPIAWHTPDGWYIVQQRFSVTTSRHQSQVRAGISAIG